MKNKYLNMLILFIVFSLFLAGCGGKKPKASNGQTHESTPASETTAGTTENPDPSISPTDETTTEPSDSTSTPNTSTPGKTSSKPSGTTGSPSKSPSPSASTPTPPPFQTPEGISWPKGQALPHFASPAETLDTLLIQTLNYDERITFTALQGLINRERPRIYLLDSGADEGTYTWANTSTVNLRNRKNYTNSTKYDLIVKYAGELDGVILYSTERSLHYRNLAATIAGLENAIPVTQEVYDKIKEKGVNLKVVADITNLTHTSATSIYNYLYDNYWARCEKRIILSATPENVNDLHGTRDVQVAVGAAVVWLDCRNSGQKQVFEKFLSDMTPGEAVILGWYTTERSGVTTGTKHGIGTVPSNFFISGTVYGGQEHKIQIPEAPAKPKLENKVYITIYISDGDNIQYNQRYMRKLWDQTLSVRRNNNVPMNWTIAPALVDIAPGIINYYYTTATDNDCFVVGPSGMGYIMPYNTLDEKGASGGEHISRANKAKLDAYVKLTNDYMKKAGLRVITVWDNLTSWQRQSYSSNGPDILGVTVQRFGNHGNVSGGVVNNMFFDRLLAAYGGDYNGMKNTLSNQINNWNGNSPKFVSYQVSVWGNVKPNNIIDMYKELKQTYGDKFEFVRADHYFELYYEANGITR